MALTHDQFSNFASSTVAGGAGGAGTSLGAADTSLLVATGAGATFPSVGPFMALLTNGATTEIVKCTSRSGDTLTIVRAQEGTSASAFPVGASVAHGPTALTYTNLWSRIQGVAYYVGDYGAVGDGVTDDTAAIQAAITAASNGGLVLFENKTYLVSTPLTLSTAGVRLVGSGRRGTILRPSANFSGAAVISVSGDYCGVQDLQMSYASSTVASNPSANGINVTALHFHYSDLEFFYINGYCLNIAASNTQGVAGSMGARCHAYQCAGAVHLLGNTNQGFAVQAWLSDMNFEQCTTLDCLFIEDANDVLVSNSGGAATQGAATNSAIHVKGACSSVYFTNPDFGVISTASAPTMLIESGTNGAPSRVSVVGGILQAGTYCVQATNGTNLLFQGVQFAKFTQIGVSLELAGAMYAALVGCEFSSASTTGTTGRYDLNVPSSSARVTVEACIFRDVIGSAAGQVNATVNCAGGRFYMLNNDFEGATFANFAQGGTLPGLLVNNANINPVGSVAVTVGASPYTVPAKPYPVVYYVSGGTVTSLVVDSVTTGLTSGAVRVPAGVSLVITYSVAPTVVGVGE